MGDSAGITILENDSQSTALALGERLYRLGAVDGPRALFQVTHVFLTVDGAVGVVESSANLIRFFDRHGQPDRVVGGSGGGPGEFRALSWAAVGPADTLVAFDRGSPTTVSVFDSTGAFARSFPVPHIGSGRPEIIDSWPDGDVLVLMQGTGPYQAGETFEWGLYSVSRPGLSTTDLGSWSIGRFPGGFELFAHRASFAAAGDRLLYTPGDRFAIQFYDRIGNLQRISRVRRTRAPVTQAEVDAFWIQLGTRDKEQADFLRNAGSALVADSMPAYGALLANETDGFWASRAAVPGDSIEVWDVFDADGVYEGAVALPPRFHPKSLSDRYVAGITRDESDIEFVEVYEWTWPKRAALPTSGVHSR